MECFEERSIFFVRTFCLYYPLLAVGDGLLELIWLLKCSV